jgi:glyoxylase-like metal-dependent hydrolase (beta-lactamase superfamily II)
MGEEDAAGDVPAHPEPPVEAPAIEPRALQARLEADEPIRVLDVRDRDEFEAWRIQGASLTATHVPLSKILQAQVTDRVADLAADIAGAGPITTVCAAGEASAYVAGLLVDAGFDARNLEDGMDGWARVYTGTRIGTDPSLIQYHRPSSGCLGYMLIHGDEAAVVDPLRAFTDRYLGDAAAADAEIVAVVDSHLHADHVSGLRALAEAAGAEPYLPAETLDRGVAFDVTPVTGDTAITVGGSALRAVDLQGHTTGMTGFTVGETLLTADSLFIDGVARPDLQVEAAEARATLARTLHETLVDRLGAFGDETVIAPGHVGESVTPRADGSFTATLGSLRDSLAVFDVDEEAFLDRVLDALPPRPANAGRILAVNSGATAVDAAEAFELELGPNNCAAGELSG